jgi:hypothetical protein
LTGFGAAITGQVSFNWPFNTTSSSYETKIALDFNGGYSSIWNNISVITFVDNVGSYQLLWVNSILNKFVFLMPNRNTNVATVLNISGLNNPYPYQRELYNLNSTNCIINFYSNYVLENINTFSQPAFASTFTLNPSLIFVNLNQPSNNIDNYPSTNTFAPGSTNILILSL